ncbi:MAG: hypothetical protein ACHQAQ_05640 [Hyphomicrobiales bacterium]
MLIDAAAAMAIILAAAAIAYLGLSYDVASSGLALLAFAVALSELMLRRRMPGRPSFKIAGFVLALIASFACAVLGHLAVLWIAAFDGAPDIARQFFAPLTAGAICASIGALAHRARYRVRFSFVIALACGLYAVFGLLKLGLGNAWLRA